jgi:deazaflavin-dependent oxidoreductase (nitroreductase family)
VTVDPVMVDATDDDYCYLTTRGRVSGRPHEIEIWFARDGATLYVMAGAGDRSDWVRNLVAEPAVTVRVRGVTFAATARVVAAGTDEDALARRIVTDKFRPRYHGSLDDWQVRSLPVALDVAGRA